MLSFQRSFSKVVPTKVKHKSKSSFEWLSRQLSDPYVEKAKIQNYRCRSAFKLLEIHDRYKILNEGDIVIDCGASPGSWTQVAVNKCNPKKLKDSKSLVIGIDKLQMHPIQGAELLGNLDFTKSESQEKIKQILNGRLVNVVLSDMAPNASGVREMDHDNIISLCYSVLKFALDISCKNATLLVKVWDGGRTIKLEQDIARFYNTVKSVKPASSRSDSSEKFLLARGFKGIVK
uniref:rRNA methyltransferase 2, mitochondrial n=1 Tax=Xenopsylla cheopis TaxID=163159 RepID=A0A6M2DK82_XENCH